MQGTHLKKNRARMVERFPIASHLRISGAPCSLQVRGFSHGRANREALLALHPRMENDDHSEVTFLCGGNTGGI